MEDMLCVMQVCVREWLRCHDLLGMYVSMCGQVVSHDVSSKGGTYGQAAFRAWKPRGHDTA